MDRTTQEIASDLVATFLDGTNRQRTQARCIVRSLGNSLDVISSRDESWQRYVNTVLAMIDGERHDRDCDSAEVVLLAMLDELHDRQDSPAAVRLLVAECDEHMRQANEAEE